MALDKADEEEKGRGIILGRLRIFGGVQRSIKTFITFALLAF